MSRLTPVTIILSASIFLTIATIAFSQGCPDCFFDNNPPMDGPASADGRRTISVKIDSTWGTPIDLSLAAIWQDANHNGVAEISELHTLQAMGFDSIELDYKESKRTDEYGNRFRYRAKVKSIHNSQLGRWAWDVILVPGG